MPRVRSISACVCTLAFLHASPSVGEDKKGAATDTAKYASKVLSAAGKLSKASGDIAFRPLPPTYPTKGGFDAYVSYERSYQGYERTTQNLGLAATAAKAFSAASIASNGVAAYSYCTNSQWGDCFMTSGQTGASSLSLAGSLGAKSAGALGGPLSWTFAAVSTEANCFGKYDAEKCTLGVLDTGVGFAALANPVAASAAAAWSGGRIAGDGINWGYTKISGDSVGVDLYDWTHQEKDSPNVVTESDIEAALADTRSAVLQKENAPSSYGARTSTDLASATANTMDGIRSERSAANSAAVANATSRMNSGSNSANSFGNSWTSPAASAPPQGSAHQSAPSVAVQASGATPAPPPAVRSTPKSCGARFCAVPGG
jgi:hypothetical protein